MRHPIFFCNGRATCFLYNSVSSIDFGQFQHFLLSELSTVFSSSNSWNEQIHFSCDIEGL